MEELQRRNHGEVIMEKEPWRHHGGGVMGKESDSPRKEASKRNPVVDKSWRRKQARGIQEEESLKEDHVRAVLEQEMGKDME